MFIAGFDIGGTKSEVIFLKLENGEFKELSRKRIPTQREKPYDTLIIRLKDLFFLGLKDANLTMIEIIKMVKLNRYSLDMSIQLKEGKEIYFKI